MKYYVIPFTGSEDGDLPTTPEPMELSEISAHIEAWLGRFRVQGYYSTVRQERVLLDSISFRIVPADDSHGMLSLMLVDYVRG